MPVTKKDVEYVAKLARLEFNETEKEKFTEEFNNILKFVETLSEVNTENIDISISSNPSYNVLRDDIVYPSLSIEDTLLNAPDCAGGYFKVPKVVE